MKKRVIGIVILLALAGAGLTAWWSRGGARNGALECSGNVEVTDARLGFRIPGRLSVRLVEEGEAVQAGQELARLESADQEIALAQAEANAVLLRAGLAELEAGSRPEEIRRAEALAQQARRALEDLESGSRRQEVAGAKADLERALALEKTAAAQLKQATADRERFGALVQAGSVGERELELVKTQLESARNGLEEAGQQVRGMRERVSLLEAGARPEAVAGAKAALEAAEAQHALVAAGPRAEVIDQARARLKVAEAGVRQARQQLEYTHLVAPFAGTVLSKSAEPGEFLAAGAAVVSVGDLEHAWLRAWVGERDLGRLRLGQAFEVRTDSFPDKTYAGRLGFIGSEAEFTPKYVQTRDERSKLMYRVKIFLENQSGELKPGMPADAVAAVAAGAGAAAP